MRNFFKNAKNKVNNKINNIRIKVQCQMIQMREAIVNPSGEAYVDTAVKIIIGVVVGAVILGGLYALFNTTVLPTLETKISGMFDFAG